MLNELLIRNLGVIEEAVAEFSDGFTVVTGETGAGKTMVVTGLKLLSGARADSQRVRAGTERASVDGVFTTGGDPRVDALIEDVGGYLEDGEVVASRSVSASGRSRAHLAGRTVAAGVLGDFSSRVLTIHGQSDQLQLLDPARQLRSLDRFAGLDGQRREYRRLRREWAGLARDLQERTEQRRDLALEAETLRRSLEEIDDLDPQPGEDDELKISISRLQDADEVRDSALRALAAIDGAEPDAGVDETPAAEALSAAAAALAECEAAEPRFGELADRLTAIVADLGDISGEIGAALADVPSPESLDGLLNRQQALRELRKYAADIDGVLQWRDRATKRLDSIDVSGDALDDLRARAGAAAEAMVAAACDLSQRRATAADAFADAVSAEIAGLQMSAALQVDVRAAGGRGAERAGVEHCGSDGIDDVEFRLLQGGKANSLAATASGGELSRVMLALEVILAGSGRTMVFDEVDSGVGGRAAVEIGRRLARLAVDNQVIVVTHLPQVAAFADSHIHVAKAASEETVRSSVRNLSTEERVEELSRMLAGLESDTGRAHAEELLDTACRAKAQL